MNHTMRVAAIAQRMIVGKPLTLGITMLGMAGSMEPNALGGIGDETKDYEHVVHGRYKQVHLEARGKEPAIEVKEGAEGPHTTSARTMRPTSWHACKVRRHGQRLTRVDTWCMMIVAAVMPMPPCDQWRGPYR